MSIAASPFAVAGEFISNSALLAQQADYNSESNNKAFSQSLYAQNLAPQNYVSGLRSAGLPVSLAMHGGFQPAQAPSPMPVTTHPVSVANAMSSLANADLAQAQARKTDAEANMINNEVTRQIDADLTFNANIRAYLEQSDSPYAQALLTSDEVFSKGTFDSIRSFEEFKTALDNADTQKVANEVTRLVAQAQKDSPYYSHALADMPYRQLNQLIYSTLKLQEETANIIQERDVNDARIKEIMTNIAYLGSSIDEKNFNNVVRLWKTRDYQALVVKGVQAVLGLGGDVAQAYTMGKFVKGAGALKALNQANRPAPQVKGPFPHPEGYQRF